MPRELREVVVVDCVRIPVGKSGWKGMEKAGYYVNVSSQDLAIAAVKSLVQRVKSRSPQFDPAQIEDVVLGCLSQVGEQAGNMGRLVALGAGLPDVVGGSTVDRYCNAGLEALNFAASKIAAGFGDIFIAAGVEHMSHYPMGSSMDAASKAGYPVIFSEEIHKRRGIAIPMGAAADLVAQRYELSREDLDQFSLWSHQKAVRSIRDREWYRKRVVCINLIPRKEEWGPPRLIEYDECPRPEALDNPAEAYEKMSKLPPRFNRPPLGKHGAGNSSRIVDGAAAVMLMSREKAQELELKPMAKIISIANAGSEPMIMLLGPIPAMQRALDRAGLTMDDMDVIEPNEAFASPPLAFAKHFEYDFMDPRVNPTGGAIAIGHPIGASGVIYFTEMVWEMMRRNLRYGIQTLCGGGGIGIATIVEREKDYATPADFQDPAPPQEIKILRKLA